MVGNFWNSNYIKYESNGDRNKNLAINKYIEKIRPFLKDITTDLQKCNTWKTQLTIAINVVCFKDTNEEQAMHS